MTHRIRIVATSFLSSEIWLVSLAVALGMVSAPLLPVALVLAALFAVVRWATSRRLSLRTPADLAIGLLAVMLPISLWSTTHPEITQEQTWRLLAGIMLYYTIVNWGRSPARLRRLLFGVTVLGLLLAIGASVSVTWEAGKLPIIPRSFYTRFTTIVTDTINPNVMAGSLIILLPIALSRLLFTWRQLRWFDRLFSLITVLVMLGILILTQSRSAYGALLAVLATMTLLKWRRGWVLLLIIIAGLLLAIQIRGLSTVLDLLSSAPELGGLEGRTQAWWRALFMIEGFPFTGIGMGTFKDVARARYPFPDPAWDIPHAHNLFLQVAVDLGLPGLVAWLAIVINVIASAWKLCEHGRHINDRSILGLGTALLCSQIALLVHGLTDAVTWGIARPSIIVWGLWGLSMACASILVAEVPPGSEPRA